MSIEQPEIEENGTGEWHAPIFPSSIVEAIAEDSSISLDVRELKNVNGRRADGLYPYQANVQRMLVELVEGIKLNLLVASPTGSGKTFAIVELARLAALHNCPGQIFVAEPLIALAEQVYARLGGPQNESLCLRTGPSRKGNWDAPVIVCTYEVLASRCATGPQALDDVIAVVIDEVHYIASERGPVIQEILQCCSGSSGFPCVPLVALSGTLPNKFQFGRFLASINGFRTMIAGAETRPVPLSFFYYDTEKNKCSMLHRPRRPCEIDPATLGGLRGRQEMLACLRCLREHDSLPMLVVLFSCRKLDEMCDWACSLDLLNASEKSKATVGFDYMLRSVPIEDRIIFEPLRACTIRGIGKHHSHLPVCYLELVCRLAEMRVIKLVFSSSTLSAGINLPVRTVVLCGAELPQKDSRGEMFRELLPALLFQQLAGRAGRPGYETEGYCVIVGRGQRGYMSAQSLMSRPQPGVFPHDELTVGDVLRGRRIGRSVGLERALFADPAMRGQVRKGERIRWLVEQELSTIPEEERAHAERIKKSASRVLENRRFLSLAQEQNDTRLRLHFYGPLDAGLHVASAEENVTSSPFIELDKLSRTTFTFPMQDWAPLQETREALRELRRAFHLNRVLRFASLMRLGTLATEAPELASMIQVEKRVTKEISLAYLSTEGVLTQLGAAACCIRAISDPCRLINLVLQHGEMTIEELVLFTSVCLGEGRGVPGSTPNPLTDPYPALSSLDIKTEAELSAASLDWLRGDSVRDIVLKHGCSVGIFCRHIVRVTDLLEELAQCLDILHLQAQSDLARSAIADLARGLPFLRRGTGRVDVPRNDDQYVAIS